MVVDEHEVGTVGNGNALDEEATVQIEELRREPIVNREAAAHGGLHARVGKRQQAGIHDAVHLGNRIREERRVEVHGKRRTHVGEGLLDSRLLIHIVTARRVGIDLLEQREIRIDLANQIDGALGASAHAFFARGNRVRTHLVRAVLHDAFVHEERVIGRVGAEPDVVGGRGVFLVHLQRNFSHIVLDIDWLLVGDAVVGDHQIGDVASHDDHDQQDDSEEHCKNTLDGFAHSHSNLARCRIPYERL